MVLVSYVLEGSSVFGPDSLLVVVRVPECKRVPLNQWQHRKFGERHYSCGGASAVWKHLLDVLRTTVEWRDWAGWRLRGPPSEHVTRP